MTQQTFEVDCECMSCGGKGLYIGMAESDGAAIQCSKCDGSGCEHLVVRYRPFVARKSPEKEVKRVYRCNPGIRIGEAPGRCRLEDFGGITYEEWLSRKGFPAGTEDRNHTCPAWFYQSANSNLKPKWDDCEFGLFSECRHFCNKAKCWERWDKEYSLRTLA